MLLVKDILENKEEYIKALSKRNIDATKVVNQIIALDEERRSKIKQTEDLLAESNKMSKEIGDLFKSGKAQEANGLKAAVQENKAKTNVLKEELNTLEEKFKDILYHVPNKPHTSVPIGKSEEDNEVVKTVEELPKLPENAMPHWDIVQKYGLIDFESGVKITGSGFPVYKGKGAQLQRALINFFLNQAIQNGYEEVIPPLLINQDSGIGTGQLPDKEGQMYHVTGDGLYLIPTAEVPITNIYRDVIVKENEFPIKKVGYTPCFRREAGSYGKDVRGLNRLHQFDKVEIVQVVKPEDSYATLDAMVAYVETLIQKLGLPYRILRLCAGDLGFTSALTYDFEVYSAAQKMWLEVSSVSNFETYQSNRLKLRYKDEKGKSQLAHTLNGSALALPRILAALLENNQTEDGVMVPECLRPYTGFDKI
jgi:seryl-tRNA synthetase